MTGLEADAEQVLKEGLGELGLRLGEEQRERLLRYIAEIELWNPRLKLVAASGRELVVKHILDSLAPHAVLMSLLGDSAEPRVADLGSGAGLPGIPLAIAFPDIQVALVERGGRRVGFLRNCVALLGASNVTVLERDAFNVARQQRGAWDAVVMRAFLPLTAELLTAVTAMLAPGAVAALYKGRLSTAERERALASADEDVARAWTEPVTVPYLSDERTLLVFRRV